MIKTKIVSVREEEQNPFTRAVPVDVVLSSGEDLRLRSMFELQVLEMLLDANINGLKSIGYETHKIPYQLRKADKKTHHYKTVTKDYIPDFVLTFDDGKVALIEVKGFWNRDNEKKFKALREQYPRLILYFMFRKKSISADYLIKLGFKNVSYGSLLPFWFKYRPHNKMAIRRKGGVLIE